MRLCKELVFRVVLLLAVLLLHASLAVKTLSQMPVNTKVTDGANTWVIIATGDKASMVRESSIGQYAYDAAEPTSATTAYQTNGNPTWSYSNLYQYLNAAGNDWYVPKHTYDAPPDYAVNVGYKTTLGSRFETALIEPIQVPNSWSQLPWNGNPSASAGCTGSTLCQLARGSVETVVDGGGTTTVDIYMGNDVHGTVKRASYSTGFHNNQYTVWFEDPPSGVWLGESYVEKPLATDYDYYWDYGLPIYKTVVVPAPTVVPYYYVQPVWTSAASTLDIKDGVVRTNTVLDYTVAQHVHPIVAVDATKLYISEEPINGVYEMNYNKPPSKPAELTLVGDIETPGAECSVIALGAADLEGDEFVYSFELYNDVTEVWEKIGDSADGALSYQVPNDYDTFYKLRARGREVGGGPGDYLESEAIIPHLDEKPTVPSNVEITARRAGMKAVATCNGSFDAQGDKITYVWCVEVAGTGAGKVIRTETPKVEYVVPSEGEQYEVRVQAVDAKGSSSAVATSGLLQIQHNSPPITPMSVYAEGRKAGTEGLALMPLTTDPDGDFIMYYWEYSVAGGEWQEMDGTSEGVYTYTIPTGASYRVRVKAVDEYGAESGYAVSQEIYIISSAYPLPPTLSKSGETPLGSEWTNDPIVKISPADGEDTNYTGIYYSLKKLS